MTFFKGKNYLINYNKAFICLINSTQQSWFSAYLTQETGDYIRDANMNNTDPQHSQNTKDSRPVKSDSFHQKLNSIQFSFPGMIIAFWYQRRNILTKY